jgi:hypothetical protein
VELPLVVVVAVVQVVQVVLLGLLEVLTTTGQLVALMAVAVDLLILEM